MTRYTRAAIAQVVRGQAGGARAANTAALVQLGFADPTTPLVPVQRKKPSRLADNPLEEYEGEQLMARVVMYEEKYPVLKDFAHVPNGGAREVRTGAALKRQGVRRGYPDYILQVPRQGHHSLVIELKRKHGVPSDVSPEQRERIERLRAAGNRVEVCFGHEQAIAVLEDYLDIKMPLVMCP